MKKLLKNANGKKISSEKEIIVFNIDNDYIGEYKNAREASKATNVDFRLISMNCLGKIKQTKGFIFKFK